MCAAKRFRPQRDDANAEWGAQPPASQSDNQDETGHDTTGGRETASLVKDNNRFCHDFWKQKAWYYEKMRIYPEFFLTPRFFFFVRVA
jgi:hypothetical protein